MIILNFSHPLTEEQIAQVEQLTGTVVTAVHSIACQFDNEHSFVSQVETLLDEVALTATEWQTAALLINPPAYAPITAAVLADLHGRIGYFPAIIRIRPLADSLPPQFVVAEIINLQSIRDNARKKRSTLTSNRQSSIANHKSC